MRRRPFLVSALVVALGWGACGVTSAETRGITVKLRASESADAPVTEEVELYGASHALVIGIDDYSGGWPRLSNAVRDAKLVAGALRQPSAVFRGSKPRDLSDRARGKITSQAIIWFAFRVVEEICGHPY